MERSNKGTAGVGHNPQHPAMHPVASSPARHTRVDTATIADTARIELHVKEQEVQQLRESALQALEQQVRVTTSAKLGVQHFHHALKSSRAVQLIVTRLPQFPNKCLMWREPTLNQSTPSRARSSHSW